MLSGVPTRTVGTRALTLAVFATLARLLIYSGELTVFVCTKDARAVFALFCVWADARVVTPGVVPVVVTRVERTVVDGRLATVFVAVARALRVADASRAADARTAVDVVAARADVGDVVAVRDVTLRAGIEFVLRLETTRVDAVDATARDVDPRPVALRGLTWVGTTGATGVCTVGCCCCCTSGCTTSASS